MPYHPLWLANAVPHWPFPVVVAVAGCGVVAFLTPAAVLSLGEECLFSHSTQNVEMATVHVVEATGIICLQKKGKLFQRKESDVEGPK